MKKSWFFLILLLPNMVYGQSMSLAEVIREVLMNSPDIPVSRLSIDMAKADRQSIEGMLDPHMAMRLGYHEEKTPTTSPFAANKTQLGSFSGEISQLLQSGSTLTGSLNYNRSQLDYPAIVPSDFRSTINPIYQHQIDLTYRYPLLRGHGNPTYHDQLGISEQDEKAAHWRVQMLKEQLAEQAIGLYFRLAADQLALQLAKDAVLRAETLLNYQKTREKFGLIEHADRLQADALLATRRMENNIASATVSEGKTKLNRLMLRPINSPLLPDMRRGSISEANIENHALDRLIEEAERVRPVFKLLMTKMRASELRLSIARNQSETQLDLIGQLGSRALDGNSSQAFSQGFSLQDRFISISIEWSDTLIANKDKALIKRVELLRQQVTLEQTQARESLRDTIALAFTRLMSAKETVIAAEQRAKAEKNKFDAEIARYKEGRSDTATIIQFEGDLRVAQLQAAMQQVSLKLVTYQLALARGILLPILSATSDEEMQL
ncbi:MAG: TolC family protein [Mariprofundaceae bacterium]